MKDYGLGSNVAHITPLPVLSKITRNIIIPSGLTPV